MGAAVGSRQIPWRPTLARFCRLVAGGAHVGHRRRWRDVGSVGTRQSRPMLAHLPHQPTCHGIEISVDNLKHENRTVTGGSYSREPVADTEHRASSIERRKQTSEPTSSASGGAVGQTADEGNERAIQRAVNG